MHTVKLLINLVEHHQVLVYFLIFIGLVFEGDVVLISTGILIHLGALNFWLALAFILLGALGKTLLGYSVGIFLHNKWRHTRFMTYVEKKVSRLMPHFQEKPFWSIFLSKFIMGTGQVVTIFSGYKRISFKKYMQAESIATIIWAPGVMLLGYFFSYTALHVSRDIWRFSFIVLLLVVGFLCVDKFVSWLYELAEEFHDHGNKQ